ncbi:flagellar filament capping protein FliD [Clostridium sp. Mt-5]|uniref:Flagellar hook-associated protein 2 n=2 Tax=Clostridium moutaii TaxID=3240932 RepID=A0ABV4BJ43_9CLOT
MAGTTTSTASSMPIGATGAGGGNMLRITGLNTGLDVDSMVKKMLTSDQTKIDQVKQQQQLIQWKQEAYQSIITDVKDLQSAYFDITNSANYLLSSGSYDNMTATSGDPTTATAKAAATASSGIYKISVSQLAQAASISSTTSLNTEFQVTDINNWKGAGKTINFSVDGTADASPLDLSGFTGTTVSDLASYINNQISQNTGLSGKVSVSYVNDGKNDYIKFTPLTSSKVQITASGVTDITSLNTNLTAASLTTDLTSLDSSLNTNLTLNLSYNGKNTSVSVDNTNGTATLNDLITAIKNATGGTVTGSFDDITGKFILQTTSTGSISNLSITGDSTGGRLLSALGLPAVGSSAASSQGKDALVSITPPGSSTATTLTESSNNFIVNGISYSVTGITLPGNPTSISVTQDTSKVHDLISNFIDKYNNLVGEIQDKLSERKDYNYQPLTDAQKSSMSATDITNWETKAKQGILENDDNLESLLNDLTNAFNAPVLDSSGKSVSTLYFGSIGSNAIGIDTSNDYTQGAKLSITDDQQFTNALTNHADEIMKLFTTTSDSTDPTTNFNQSGIFQRISQIINNNVGVIGSTYNSGTLTKYANLQDDYSISGGAGTGTLPDQIYQQQLLINNLTDQMNNDQTKYYDQFTQLETAMEQLNAQQSSLSMYLG